jgi:alpha-L-fucosidase
MNPTAGVIVTLMLAWGLGGCATSREPSGPYLPEDTSLSAHGHAPEWFSDAKLGIYFHWGVYSVPAHGSEWYPRWMYFPDHAWSKHHADTWGADFDYHEFVPLFTAEHFEADEWAALFRQAGARFAGPVAEHHDGFSMWASKATPWNAAERGPGRDLTGELEQAIRAEGMRFVATFHHARNLQRYQETWESEWASDQGRRRFRNSHYPYTPGTGPASRDPDLRLLYGNLPEDEWLETVWLAKLKEVVDAYHPDLIWFDSWLDQVPMAYRQRFAAYYFNRASQRGQDVLIARKQQDLPLTYSVDDFEKGRLDKLTEEVWLTDDTISKGSWCYTEDLKVKTPRQVLHDFVDIVSKNGVLLLNLSPRADGTIPENQREVLVRLGKWLDQHGAAIYDTRPWTVYGEGPTRMPKSGGFVPLVTYTADDIRYTRSKDGTTLYAIILGWPGAGREVTFRSIQSGNTPVTDVTLLGHDRPVPWESSDDGLRVVLPERSPDDLAVVLRIDLNH